MRMRRMKRARKLIKKVSHVPASFGDHSTKKPVICPGCKQKYHHIFRLPYRSDSCGHTVCEYCKSRSYCLICYASDVDCQPVDWHLHSTLLEMVRVAEANEKHLLKLSLEETTLKMEKGEPRLVALSDRADALSERACRAESEVDVLRRKCEKELPNAIDHVACVDCLVMFKREKMKICVQCTETKSTSDFEPDPLPAHPICGFCVVENHSGHKIINYLSQLIRDSFSSAVTSGFSVVGSSQADCNKEMEKGYQCIKKWRVEMGKFLEKLDFEEVGYRKTLSVVSSLRYESGSVHRAANKVLPVLEEFAGAVQESSTRLSLLYRTLAQERVDKDTVDKS